MDSRTIAIVDGNSLLHRAFHALPITLTGKDGRPTNAVYGFLTMLFRLVEDLEPFGVIVAFDCGRPQFRMDVLEQYKVHRAPTAPELKDQFPMIRQVLQAMEVPCVELEGWEGDDILGTLAEDAKSKGFEVLLITSDKDAMQLVDEHVRVVSSRRNIGDLAFYGRDEVRERFGVDPEQMADFLGLMGDSSDNIPGVPGVGAKTAAKLLAEHGTLESVLDAAADIPGKVGENLRSHAQDAVDSRLVATIRRDVPIEVDLNDATWGGWDPARVLEVFKEFRVSSLVGKVLASGEIAQAEEVLSPGEPHKLLTGVEAQRAVEAALGAPGDVWLGAALGSSDAECLLPTCELAVALADANALVAEDKAQETCARLLATARVASPDAKSLVHAALAAEPAAVFDARRLLDTSVAAYVLDSARSSYDIQAVHSELRGAPLDAGDALAGRLAADSQAAAQVAEPLLERLSETGALDCFERCEMPLIPVLARMERAGVAVDRDRLEVLAAEMESDIAVLVSAIHELAGTDDFNIDSPKQLGEILFEKLQLPRGKRTKTGFSTDSSVLTPLAKDFPIAEKILAYRELAKLKSTYVDAVPRLLDAEGRVHTTFNQTVAATGRLSSSNPNMQNIPVRTELGRHIRAAFVPGEGFDRLLTADYSQIELRILAHCSADPGLIEAFTSGEDFHTATAARVFGVAPDAVDTGLRSRAKATNFGIVYGISAHGLALQLGIGRAEAQEMIDRYYTAYPKVREFLDDAVARARETGYAVTMLGRRRPIPELASRNWNVRSFGERTAMNHPMQGAAADIMKLAMVAVDEHLREEGLTSRLVLQVHDELVFEVTDGEADRVAELAQGAMSGAAELAVPLLVDIASGSDWAAAK